jgi:hypothetical protein
MFNIGYFKGLPTEYIIRYTGGRLAREGQGLAFFYLKYNTQVVAVPTSSQDASFVFNEVTRNFQAVTIQGQFTYRILEAKKTAQLLNFTIDPASRSYLAADGERLAQRITNTIQMETRAAIQGRTLEDVLGQYETIASEVLEKARGSDLIASLGVELMGVVFVAAKPTPEVGKALEAPYREQLLQQADEATYIRRAAAVEAERKIKESELSTDIALEEQRRSLIDLQGENGLREAESRGRALEKEGEYQARAREAELAVYRTFEPRALLALALEEMGRNAERVGNLTITSEMLASLLNGRASSDGHD